MSETKLLRWTVLLGGRAIVQAINSIREWMKGNDGWSIAWSALSTISLTTVLFILVYGGGE